jgi:PHD/YefM family antitoxin component YafN of YafNO toxin-antitoxin module
MEIFSLKEWEDNFDELFARVENGERLGILREDGKAAVLMPADDELIKLYTDHEEGS